MQKMPENITVLFESDEVLAVNKPAGLLIHGDGRSTEPTLADWVLAKYPNIADVGEQWETPKGEIIPRPGIVHRLDRDTSGVLLIAKTNASFAHLKEQFQNRKIKKEYRAFVYGIVKEDKGVIDRPIGKSASDFRKWSAQRGAKGVLRDARTRYEVIARGDEWSYLAVFPETGRTHQIRVHLKAINHPVVCDSLYAPARASHAGGPKHPCILGFDRLALHAHKITFTGLDGTERTVEAPLPEEFGLASSA